MTPEAALVELLERVRARHGASVTISHHELSAWPSAAVAAMKLKGLLTKAQPATSAVCPGCERECVMRVHVLTDKAREPAPFIVCDKRSDINRVAIPVSCLEQWPLSDADQPASHAERHQAFDELVAQAQALKMGYE